jgi:hypothetical protein
MLRETTDRFLPYFALNFNSAIFAARPMCVMALMQALAQRQ